MDRKGRKKTNVRGKRSQFKNNNNNKNTHTQQQNSGFSETSASVASLPHAPPTCRQQRASARFIPLASNSTATFPLTSDLCCGASTFIDWTYSSPFVESPLRNSGYSSFAAPNAHRAESANAAVMAGDFIIA